MWQLPALVAGNNSVRLPLTDWAAHQISAALLSEGAEQRQALFARTLQDEPSLLLWTLCVAPRFRESPPCSLDDVAAWLSQSVLKVLSESARWPSLRPTISEAQRLRWAEMARSAAQFELVESPQDRELAAADVSREFQRRIVDPAAWTIDGGSCDELLPSWLSRQFQTPDTATTTRSVHAEASGTDLAQDMRQRWLAPLSPSVDVLGPLVSRLRRLEQLEHDFSRQLRDAKLAALKELAYGASHEINNPLANIATRAQTLLADEPDSERRRKLATIAAQAFRAHEMISDLMLFARPPALRRQSTDLVPLVAAVLREFADDARVRRITLRQAGWNEPLWASVDPTQLAVALHALVRNALEVVDGPNLVEVTLSQATEAEVPTATSRVLIAVRDHGPGVAANARDHLFDPFFSGREAGRGLGFGLSKCWRIVTDHGGDVRVEDAEGGGARFIVELPLLGDSTESR